MAELVDLHKEFHLGNRFTLNVASNLAKMLDENYRVIVKYDTYDLPKYDDEIKNIIFSTSREIHDIANDIFEDNVFAIFQNYFSLDRWGNPIHNPISYPMPIGPFVDLDKIPQIKPLHDRKYDFSFIGQIPHTGTRDGFKRNLDRMLEETGDKFKYFVKYTDGFAEGFSREEYLDLLNESRIVLCPCGAFSKETFRFFEILKMGAIPMVETLPKLWYYEEAPMFHCAWQRLDDCLSMSLNYLYSEKCKLAIDRLIRYNMTVLDENNLAAHLFDKIKFKESLDKKEVNKAIEEFKSIYNAGN